MSDATNNADTVKCSERVEVIGEPQERLSGEGHPFKRALVRITAAPGFYRASKKVTFGVAHSSGSGWCTRRYFRTLTKARAYFETPKAYP